MNNEILACVKFDYCIIDEAAQIIEPLAVGVLLKAPRFAMFGDYLQLNPMVCARKQEMGQSLFERLVRLHQSAYTLLNKQYRMNADILSLANELMYKGEMASGS